MADLFILDVFYARDPCVDLNVEYTHALRPHKVLAAIITLSPMAQSWNVTGES